MKKLIVFLLFDLIIIIFSSCSKDNIIESNNNDDKPLTGKIGLTTNGPFDLAKFDTTNSNLRQPDMRMLYCEWGWYWDDGFHWGILWCDCFSITVNCLPTVTINGNQTACNNFKSYFDNDSLQKYFSTDDYKSIFPGLDDLGIVDKLQNGEITLYLDHDTLMNKDFYIGLPQGIEFSRTDTSWMSKTECVLVIDDDL